MDFKRLSGRARELVEKRGGTESLKQDADELRRIAKGPGSVKDKAKSAAGALKRPGAGGGSTVGDKVQEAAPAPPRTDAREEDAGTGSRGGAL